jgi:hypothetical protein
VCVLDMFALDAAMLIESRHFNPSTFLKPLQSQLLGNLARCESKTGNWSSIAKSGNPPKLEVASSISSWSSADQG